MAFFNRMKTTINVDPALFDVTPKDFQDDVSEEQIDAFLRQVPFVQKEVFSFDFYFDNQLTSVTEALKTSIMFGHCQCSMVFCAKCVFRLKKTEQKGRVADLSPMSYLEELNTLRKNLLESQTDYNDAAIKVVKRLGNVAGHLMYAHADDADRELLVPVWNHSCFILAFRKAFQPRNYETSRATRALAEGMVRLNRVLSVRSLAPMNFSVFVSKENRVNEENEESTIVAFE